MSEQEITFMLVGGAVGFFGAVVGGFALDLWCTCRGTKKRTELIQIQQGDNRHGHDL